MDVLAGGDGAGAGRTIDGTILRRRGVVRPKVISGIDN
jgi:hypothetical protein